jgi:hypothetical protein
VLSRIIMKGSNFTSDPSQLNLSQGSDPNARDCKIPE